MGSDRLQAEASNGRMLRLVVSIVSHGHGALVQQLLYQLAQLSAFASRTMALQATIQDGAIWLSDSQNNLEIHLTAWQPAS